MVFRKLLASLGLGGVEADTVLAPQPAAAGSALNGQVNLRVKSDTEIGVITLILVTRGQAGEVELSRQQVGGNLSLAGGSSHSVPFSMTVPPSAPFTVLYGQALPGVSVGVRTELTVTSGSAKGDFDPVHIEATPTHQSIMDALGGIGARFARNEVRPGAMVGLPAAQVQAVTFYAPVPEGQQLNPSIPQVTFLLLGTETGMTVVAELASRPGYGNTYTLTLADIARLSAEETGWIAEVDTWLIGALDQLGSSPAAAPGSFLQQSAAGQPGYGHQGHGQPGYGHQPGYAYRGQGQPGYHYGGYRSRGPSMAGTMMAGVAGGALGFLGGMMIADMLMPDMPADMGAMTDPGVADAGYDDMGGDFGGDF